MKSKKLVTSIIVILILINLIYYSGNTSLYSDDNKQIQLSSLTSISFSTSINSPTTIEIDKYYESTNFEYAKNYYIKVALIKGEAYMFYSDSHESWLYLYSDTSFSQEIESGEDNALVFAPAESKTYYLKWTSSVKIGVFKAEKHSFQEISEGINLKYKDDDWAHGLIYFVMPNCSLCTSTDSIEIETSTNGMFRQIDINSGHAYNSNEISSRLDNQLLLENQGKGFIYCPEQEGNFKITIPMPDTTLQGVGIVILVIIAIIGTIIGTMILIPRLIRTIRKKSGTIIGTINFIPHLISTIKKKKKKKIKILDKKLKTIEESISPEEIEDEYKFENLLKTTKELAEKGKKEYSNESYDNAIQIWTESIDSYILAQEKSPSESEKTKIEENIKILKENICNALIEDGKKRNLTAKKAHEQENLQKAEEEWKLAKTKFQLAIDSIKSEKCAIPLNNLEVIMNAITLNLQQLEIEKICIYADKKLKQVDSLKDENLTESINICHDIIAQYIKAKGLAEKRAEFEVAAQNIQTKIINSRSIQSQLEDKRDELMNISLVRTETVLDETLPSNIKAPTLIKAEELPDPLTIIRDYDLVGGKIRFKISIANNTSSALTSFKITFDFPKALKLITHEPNYERNGDSILIPKIGKNDKIVFSLFLEPIDCVVSPIHATISYFDAKDKPHAVIMEPKIVEIVCPMFLTLEAVNVASVKNYHQHLNHKDKKVFAISDISKCSEIFNSVLIVLGEYDIKLVYKEYSERGNAGEAWFYGVTKKDKDKVITHMIIDGSNRVLEIEVSGDDDRKITSFLAKVRNSVKALLIKSKILKPESEFDDIVSSIRLNQCPQCSGKISMELVNDFFKGKSITCKYCGYYIRS